MNQSSKLARQDVALDDKYRLHNGWVFLSGTQALVRLPIQQRMRDAAEGKNTGAYISGYRGSPLGRYDMELWAANPVLKERNIFFRPGVNEDLAATAIWGSQHVGALPGSRVDGVFGIWYGKGPGVDRSGDVFRHGNTAGTSPLGGVLVLAGDDHGAKSSTIANFSDQILIAAGMPVLYPSNTQELLDFGLHGIAMSRFSGCWVGMKVVTDVVEGGGTIHVDPESPRILLPEVPSLPAATPYGPASLSIRPFDMPLAAEERLYSHKIYAALAYARANRLNLLTRDAVTPRIAVVSAGKAYQDVCQAVADLGWSDEYMQELGIRMAKVGMIWPLDPEFVRELARDVELILVVEEKRPLLEDQIKSILYDLKLPNHAKVIGKTIGSPTYGPRRGASIFPNGGEVSPLIVSKAMLDVVLMLNPACDLLSSQTGAAPKKPATVSAQRLPTFCSGCPHNRSTKVIEGSRALAGIGCHAIATLINPTTTGTISHMGGEGMMWLGQQPFTDEAHVFANMGDGTYFHSGFLAIRQAVAAKAPMTFKLLVNGFVSMTGGQPIDGDLSVEQTIRQLLAEGVVEVALVSDEPEKHRYAGIPAEVKVYHRDVLESVQQRLRDVKGVTVLLYEQACATERRRLRKRGKWPDPAKRTFINAAVCEGCGDCGAVSNCLSIEPLETPFGRKRQINQNSCNKDYTCVEGFCPSFVTVHGGTLRKPVKAGTGVAAMPELPLPVYVRPDRSVSVLIGGIGGTGVVTIGQVLGMAAHLDGLACSILDVTGLSQKYGAVLSHVHIAPSAAHLHATRIAPGSADTVIGCDLIVTAGDEALSRMLAGRTRTVVCTDVIPTSEFARNLNWGVDAEAMLGKIQAVCGDQFFAVEGVRIAKALLGDTVAANMFMLGAAWQCGWVPVTLEALYKAIELNAVQVDFNKDAFDWGRRAAFDPASVQNAAAPARIIQFVRREQESLEDIVLRHEKFLIEYDGTAYAKRYRAMVERVAGVDRLLDANQRLTKTVALSYFKLLAIKDEWEVARLYVSDEFRQQLSATFEGNFKLHFHLGAWPFAKTDKATGKIRKAELGPWIMTAFQVMNALRKLRGTWLDPFRGSMERRLGKRLLEEYERDLDALVAEPRHLDLESAIALAALPQKIRGYGHVREASALAAIAERARIGVGAVKRS